MEDREQDSQPFLKQINCEKNLPRPGMERATRRQERLERYLRANLALSSVSKMFDIVHGTFLTLPQYFSWFPNPPFRNCTPYWLSQLSEKVVGKQRS